MTSQPNRKKAPRALATVIATTVALGALVGALLATVVLPQGSTAEARLVVGNQTLSAQAVPGYSLATQQVATTYARLVSSDEVTQTVKGDVKSVEATAIADSAIIRVQAKAGNDKDALAAAKAGSQRLVAIADQARKADSAPSTMAKYNAAYRTFQTANKQLGTAKAAQDQSAIDAAQRRVAQTQLNLNSYSTLYQQQMTSNGTGTTSLTIMSQPAIVKQQAMRLPLMGALLGGFLVAALWALRAMVGRTRRANATGAATASTGARRFRERPQARDGSVRGEDSDSIRLPDAGARRPSAEPSGTGRP